MAAYDEYNPDRNTTFQDDSIDIRLKKIDITLKKLTDFYKANVKNKHSNASKAQLRKLKSSILTIRKGRKDMIDANNLIKKTLGLSVVTSAIQNQQTYSPLDNVSPNSSSPSKSKKKKSLFRPMFKSKSQKGGVKNTKTQKKKRV